MPATKIYQLVIENKTGAITRSNFSNYVAAYRRYSELCEMSGMTPKPYREGVNVDPEDITAPACIFIMALDKATATDLLLGYYCEVCDEWVSPAISLN